MDGFDQFAKGLTDEVMADMAENFFTSRARLEKDIDRFANQAQRLKRRLMLVCARYLFFKALLPGMVRDFFNTLDAPEPVFDFDKEPLAKDFYPAPKALTLKGRWTKYVQKAYALFWKELDEYLLGHYVADEENGIKKRLTVNRKSLLRLSENINAKVEEVNSTCSPVCVLQYVKSLDPEQVEKEKLTGATLSGYACSLDNMNFTPVDFDSYELPDFPAYPNPEQAGDLIEMFCSTHYSGSKNLISDAVRIAGAVK